MCIHVYEYAVSTVSNTACVSDIACVCVACAPSTKLLLNIVRPADVTPCDEHRLIWCPYMPEDDEQSTSTGTTLDSCAVDDAAKLLVLTHGSVVSHSNTR